MRWRWTDKVALAWFVTALAGFAAFHAMPIYSHRWHSGISGEWQTDYGWMIWEEWWEGATHLDQIEFDMPGTIAWAAVHAMVGMVIASPWLVRLLSVHRVLWWLAALMSGATMVGLTGLIGHEFLTNPGDGVNERWHLGFVVLLLVPVMHFLGMMFVRRRPFE